MPMVLVRDERMLWWLRDSSQTNLIHLFLFQYLHTRKFFFSFKIVISIFDSILFSLKQDKHLNLLQHIRWSISITTEIIIDTLIQSFCDRATVCMFAYVAVLGVCVAIQGVCQPATTSMKNTNSSTRMTQRNAMVLVIQFNGFYFPRHDSFNIGQLRKVTLHKHDTNDGKIWLILFVLLTVIYIR